MNANVLLDKIREYNSHEEDIFNYCADLFISLVQNQLEEIHKKREWAKMVGCTQLGIAVHKCRNDFNDFEFELSYLMRNSQNIHDEYHLPTFHEFLENKSYEGSELCGYIDEDILHLKPFCEALERKGFGCLVDDDECELIVTLDIK